MFAQYFDIASLVPSCVYLFPTREVTTKLPKDIRDECRKDPSVPKKTLLTIAGKQQQRSMLKAYQQYKDGLNPKKNTGTGKATKAQSAFNAMDTIQRKITTLDIPTLTPEGKQNFIIALNNLKQAIENTLAAATEEMPGIKLA